MSTRTGGRALTAYNDCCTMRRIVCYGADPSLT